MSKHVAIYLRVSSKAQDTRSQEPDLKRWAEGQDAPVKFYRDQVSGKTMDRPGWQKLDADIRAGKVSQVVVCAWIGWAAPHQDSRSYLKTSPLERWGLFRSRMASTSQPLPVG